MCSFRFRIGEADLCNVPAQFRILLSVESERRRFRPFTWP